MLEINDVVIHRIAENKWHVWFASCILDWCIKLNNIAIFKRLNVPGYRLVFPEKKFWDKKIQVFFPLTNEAYSVLEKKITELL